MAQRRVHRAFTAAAASLLWVAATGSPAMAGAWVQPPGGVYAKAGWLHTAADTRLDCRGGGAEADALGGRFAEQQLHLYGEWGAHDRVTLVGSWSFKDQRITDARVPEYGTRSTGDLRVGGRFAVRQGRFPLSIEGVASVPTYPATDLSRPVAEREQFLPAGSGEIEGELRTQLGWSLWPLPLYANLDVGYGWRSGAFADQWMVSTELGGASRRLFAKVEARWRLPVGDPCESSSAGAVSFHERSLRIGPEIGVRAHGPVWVNVGWNGLVSGRNVLESTQWSLSVALQRRPG